MGKTSFSTVVYLGKYIVTLSKYIFVTASSRFCHSPLTVVLITVTVKTYIYMKINIRVVAQLVKGHCFLQTSCNTYIY